MYGPSSIAGPPPPVQQGAAQNQKNDVFVGNLAFGTTEEQLHTIFSEVGKVIKVRMVMDQDTGKPRGFAFVEYEDAQAALSAIRNLNDYEHNGRRIRVNFSASSHLEGLASKLGMDLSSKSSGGGGGEGGGGQHQQSGGQKYDHDRIDDGGAEAVADALKSLSKSEMYDVVAQLKGMADKDEDEARKLLSTHPQLPEAILYLMNKLEMVKNPLPESTIAMGGGISQAPPPVVIPPQQQPSAAAPPAARADPRFARPDPRQMPPPPSQFQQPPPLPPPPTAGGAVPPQPQIPGLDPALVQQVMSLTPQQIQQLPPDKQQSILALRQRIISGQL